MIKIQNIQEKMFDTILYSVYKNKNVCYCNFFVLFYTLCFVMIDGLRNKKSSQNRKLFMRLILNFKLLYLLL